MIGHIHTDLGSFDLDFIFRLVDESVPWARILVQVMIYCRLWTGRDGHLDQSKAYDIS